MSPEEARSRPRQPAKIRSALLALGVHAAFFSLIFFGVSWQSRPTPPVQAELWSQLPPGKPVEPRAEPPPAQTPPEPEKVEPRPEPNAEPKPKPAPAKAEPPRPDPAIAEKKERERKERERKERDRKEQERQKELEKKKELEKRELERKERETRALKQAAEAKAKAETDAKAAAKAAAEAKVAAEAKAAADAAEAARQEEFNRYVNGIKAKIRGKANVPDSVRGNPRLQVRIRILPGGDVLDIVITRPSGNPVYDTAIERAIRSAQPLPVPPASSELFPRFRDLILNIEHER
jgi:colicin import membrane protein